MTERKDVPPSEAERLERLWEGRFGDEYVDRNRSAGESRASFWRDVMVRFRPTSVLEVGCNVGANLRWIASHIPARNVYGVDINLKALAEIRRDLPEVNAVWSQARELPFRDGWFDMVFTVGVLIHQPPETLPVVMAEIVRCSRRYVLCGEYFAEEPTEVPYREQKGALFKRDFGGLYCRLFPGFVVRQQGFLSRAEGWDDITYWVLERTDR